MNVTLRRSIAAAAVVLLPLLTSCGFDKPTDRVYNPGVGVNDRAGSVDVLHALVVSGEDGSGTVVAGLVNESGTEDDRLTGVAGAGEDSSMAVTFGSSIEIPADGSVQLAEEGVVAEGERVTPGNFVALTFTFQNAESVTIEVPVVARRGDFADVPVPSSETASPSESPSESPTAEETASDSESDSGGHSG